MSKKEEEVPPTPATDPDDEFWKAEGVTDDDEKEAIRSRARVNRYHDFVSARKAKEEKNKNGGDKKKKWYQKD